jgi:hypothetical protein
VIGLPKRAKCASTPKVGPLPAALPWPGSSRHLDADNYYFLGSNVHKLGVFVKQKIRLFTLLTRISEPSATASNHFTDSSGFFLSIWAIGALPGPPRSRPITSRHAQRHELFPLGVSVCSTLRVCFDDFRSVRKAQTSIESGFSM